MKIKNIKDLWISKEKFDYILNVKNKIEYEKWVWYVDNNKKYFTWYENTQRGIEAKSKIDEVPEDFRDDVLTSLNKKKAYAEFNNKKGLYEIIISFNQNTGVISTTFMKKITKQHLIMLLEMANYLDAYLLNTGKTIIDEKVIEELE